MTQGYNSIISNTQRLLFGLVLLIFFSSSAFAQRTVKCIDEGWKFHFGNASDPAKDFGCGTEYFNYLTKANSIHNTGPYSIKTGDKGFAFDDSNWKVVDLPHDFVVDLPFAKEASHSHGYKQVGYKYPETSVGWYRKMFSLPADAKGKHFELLFDGIFRDSRVWVNGFYCGGERSGYLSQCYDITDYLNFGGENLICVRADATLEEGWFYEGGGIYRHVNLIETDAVHIANDGITITSKLDENYDNATLFIKTNVRNDGKEMASFHVNTTILDAQGNVVQQNDYEEESQHKGDAILSARDDYEYLYYSPAPIKNPHLWSPATPYLYTAVIDVVENGKVVDSQRVKFGIRDVKFDKDRGFILNGKEIEIKGVNMHQDHAGVGAGIPDAMQVYRIKQLKKFGCNAYRSSHNPMSPAMLDVCDSLGIMVIDENRLSGTSEYEVSSLKKMIDRDKNHPSIILWSCGNEEWGIEWDEKGERIAKTLSDYCHIFDPTRETTFATSGGPTVEVPVDVAGYNYIVQNPIEEHRKNYPDRKCYGSEETSGCGTRGVYYDDPEGRWMVAHNRKPDSRDGSYNVIERGWKFYADRPWAAGCFYWTGFDYRGEANPLSYPATGSEFGILDYCGFPKDETYYLKSWWTNEPTLHILPHWNLQGHEGEKVSVWAYSNCDEVELKVNGKSLGKKQMPKNGHLEWEATYQPGKVVAVGYKNGKKIKTETIETTGNAAIIVPVADRNTIKADGKDVAVVNIALKDKKGRFVPTACNELTLHIDGNARILGVGNGDPSFKDVERPTDDVKNFTVKAFNGYAQVLVQSTPDAGNVELTISSNGLKTAQTKITTK